MKVCPELISLCRIREPNLPVDWEIFAFECVPDKKPKDVILQGAVPRKIGKRTDWALERRTFCFSMAEVENHQNLRGTLPF